MNIYPYVYKCTHRETGEFYIGYRRANKLPAVEDLPLYQTSSKFVRPRFDEFDWEILAEFFDPTDAYRFEQEHIKENWHDPQCLNKMYMMPTPKFRIKSRYQKIQEEFAAEKKRIKALKKLNKINLDDMIYYIKYKKMSFTEIYKLTGVRKDPIIARLTLDRIDLQEEISIANPRSPFRQPIQPHFRKYCDPYAGNEIQI